MSVAPPDLSKRNTGDAPMTLEYAERIVAVVPELTVADLGAPSSLVAEAAPSVLDRLAAVEAQVAGIRAEVTDGLAALARDLARLETALVQPGGPHRQENGS